MTVPCNACKHREDTRSYQGLRCGACADYATVSGVYQHYEAEQQPMVTIPEPENQGQVITEDEFTARLTTNRNMLNHLAKGTDFARMRSTLDRINVLHRDAMITAFASAGHFPTEHTNAWIDRQKHLSNLLDEMRILEDLEARFKEWITMIDEMLEPSPQGKALWEVTLRDEYVRYKAHVTMEASTEQEALEIGDKRLIEQYGRQHPQGWTLHARRIEKEDAN